MTAYYNEIDPYAAQWLRNLIDAGHIAPGDVDERSIVDVGADDLRGYAQAHFFAGIGGWSVALRLAGWDDDRPVWTGSCPCQPFSAAGAGKAADDGRHLWPAWFPLIAQCGPPVVFGEQVEAAIGWGWLDAVFSDLEGEGYACGAAVVPACGVGAPHIRQRLWFVADALRGRADDTSGSGLRSEAALVRKHGHLPREGGGVRLDIATRQLADSAVGGFAEFWDAAQPRRGRHANGSGILGELGNAQREGLEGHGRSGEFPLSEGRQGEERHHPAASFWSDAEWIACTDGKARPVGSGSFPLGHGIQCRTSKLRAYGNAIVPQVAAEFIMSSTTLSSQHRSQGE